jgi:hypothetical protein
MSWLVTCVPSGLHSSAEGLVVLHENVNDRPPSCSTETVQVSVRASDFGAMTLLVVELKGAESVDVGALVHWRWRMRLPLGVPLTVASMAKRRPLPAPDGLAHPSTPTSKMPTTAATRVLMTPAFVPGS